MQKRQFESVWFYPEKGLFIFEDYAIKSKVVHKFLSDGIIEYIGINKHQGLEMVEYKCNKELIINR